MVLLSYRLPQDGLPTSTSAENFPHCFHLLPNWRLVQATEWPVPSIGDEWDWKEALQLFPCLSPPPGKSGPTLPRALFISPSEELDFLSLVYAHKTQSSWHQYVDFQHLCVWKDRFFYRSFQHLPALVPGLIWILFLSMLSIFPPLLPPFHHPWINGFWNSSFCTLWTYYFCCFAVKHIYCMWEVKGYLNCFWSLLL